MVNKRVRRKPSRIHFAFNFHGAFKLVVIDQAFDENTVSGWGRVHGCVVEELLVVFESGIGFATIEVGLEDEVVGDDVGNDAGLGDEAVEGEEVSVAGLAEEGGEDGVDGENGGAAVGVDGVARVERGLVEVIVADEGENAVVQVEPVAGECRHVFGELRVVRVQVVRGLLLGFWRGLRAVQG